MWEDILAWLLSLGEEYGVDPVVYAVIYVSAAPFFFASLAWLVRTIRRRGPIGLPLLSTAVFFSLPTLYVFIAGRNLPPWAYAVLIGLVILGAVVTGLRVREQLRARDGRAIDEP
jgi:peptidoglycan/LPS O-acetylase OafA/YrhL